MVRKFITVWLRSVFRLLLGVWVLGVSNYNYYLWFNTFIKHTKPVIIIRITIYFVFQCWFQFFSFKARAEISLWFMFFFGIFIWSFLCRFVLLFVHYRGNWDADFSAYKRWLTCRIYCNTVCINGSYIIKVHI